MSGGLADWQHPRLRRLWHCGHIDGQPGGAGRPYDAILESFCCCLDCGLDGFVDCAVVVRCGGRQILRSAASSRPASRSCSSHAAGRRGNRTVPAMRSCRVSRASARRNRLRPASIRSTRPSSTWTAPPFASSISAIPARRPRARSWPRRNRSPSPRDRSVRCSRWRRTTRRRPTSMWPRPRPMGCRSSPGSPTATARRAGCVAARRARASCPDCSARRALAAARDRSGRSTAAPARSARSPTSRTAAWASATSPSTPRTGSSSCRIAPAA